MQQLSPEQVARYGNNKLFCELTADSCSSRTQDKDDEDHATTARLVDLSRKSLIDQFLESGFVQEVTEDETSVMRYRDTHGELVAIVEGSDLKGIFAPINKIRNFDPQQLEIVGTGEFEGLFDSDPVQTGVRVSNGWAEFIIDPNQPTARYTQSGG